MAKKKRKLLTPQEALDALRYRGVRESLLKSGLDKTLKKYVKARAALAKRPQ